MTLIQWCLALTPVVALTFYGCGASSEAPNGAEMAARPTPPTPNPKPVPQPQPAPTPAPPDTGDPPPQHARSATSK